MFQLEKTNNYRMQYKKLSLGLRRFIDEVEDALKLDPNNGDLRIKPLGKNRQGRLFRFRQPGLHVMYVVNQEDPRITLLQIINLRPAVRKKA